MLVCCVEGAIIVETPCIYIYIVFYVTMNFDSQDGLVRQSLTTQKADTLLKGVTNSICCLQHDMKMAAQIINSLTSKVSFSIFL